MTLFYRVERHGANLRERRRRWLLISKDPFFFLRAFQVEQRDVPGIDCAYLAMDTEEGVEVVWNEVQFSERKNFKAQEEKIQQVFENLTQLEHPNIVKFHRYWTDTHNDKPRVSIRSTSNAYTPPPPAPTFQHLQLMLTTL